MIVDVVVPGMNQSEAVWMVPWWPSVSFVASQRSFLPRTVVSQMRPLISSIIGFSIFTGFIREAPGQRYRSIDHDKIQNVRPSLIISLALIGSGFTRLRRDRMPSMISP